jgi:mannan endo-1,4-beta-mannosidase
MSAGSRKALLLATAVGLSGCLRTPDRYARTSLDANLNPPASFELNGEPFCFSGTNNYYIIYQPKPMVDDVLQSAKDLGLPVIRTWGFIDVGSPDGSVPHVDTAGDGTKNGVYFQSWDTEHKRPAYNDGDNGLSRLDYAIAKAGELGLKIIVVLTNNWRDFGGMDQYLTWYGKSAHHEFYTAPEVKQAYRDWAAHLVTRVNSVNGKTYKDDPTIFAWELANEPRCKGTGPGSPGWTNATMVGWAGEMSAYIKSIDPNHLVSVGDEGFLNGGGDHWTYKANDGVDHAALTALPGVDFGTFHMYPEDWGADARWADNWIIDHQRVGRELGKPSVLEEYGVRVTRDDGGKILTGLDRRLSLYQRWNELTLRRGGSAALVWMLGGAAESGLYKDYDHYTLYRGDETANLLTGFAKRFATEAPACRTGQWQTTAARSAFVRVHRQTGRVALEWSLSDG